MSRSYQKFPGFTDNGGSRKQYKRYANKAVRKANNDHLSNGSMFKKFYESYNICDYIFMWYSENELNKWLGGGDFPDKRKYRYYMKK